MNPHFPKCLLCGNQSLQLQLRSRNQSILTKWRRRVAVSLWQILELDDTFEDIFSDVTFCYRCQEIVCNAEFTVNAISRLQRELGCIRENIKSLILCNYHEVIAPTHIPFQGRENDSYDSDPDMDASYNRTVERIVRRMGVQAEPVPSDVDENDNENMELAESKESSFPGILPTSRPPPRQHPQRLAALKKRQKRQRPDPLTKSSNMKSSTNDSSLSLISKKRKQEPALSSFDPLENITTYSRSGRKIKPLLNPSDMLELNFDSSEEEQEMDDFGYQDMDYTAEESAESEEEDERNEIENEDMLDIKLEGKSEPEEGVTEGGRSMEIKFTCNYQDCLPKQLTFPRPRDVKAHLETVHGGEGLGTLYHCAHCLHRCKNMEKLRRHYLIHKELRPKYPCVTCGKEYLTARARASHKRKCSESTGPVKCKFCKTAFLVVDDLAAHVKLHSKLTPFDCVQCEAKLKNKFQLAYHVKTVHEGRRRPKQYEEAIGPFPCNFPSCFKNLLKLTEFQDMKTHLFEEHGQHGEALELVYHCTQCDHRFKLNRTLQRHLKEEHGDGKTTRQEAKRHNLCSVCGKLFHSKPTLRQHLRVTHTAFKMKPKCSYCTKTCDTLDDLRTHEQLHSIQTPYKCVLCADGDSFITTIDLHNHVYNTHEILPFKCTEEGCNNKGFETKLRLDWHRKTTHGSGERPHPCPHCPFSAWCPSGLKFHLRSHAKEKHFICEFQGCQRAFVWKTQLTRHVRLQHWNGPVTMVPCKVCGKEFLTKGTMKAHERHHSDVRPFLCHLCPAAFKAPKHLQRHVQGHANGSGLKGETWKPRKSRLLPLPVVLPTAANQSFMPQRC